jgi:pimeloyl-ACP methyl ester carboxylesterase
MKVHAVRLVSLTPAAQPPRWDAEQPLARRPAQPARRCQNSARITQRTANNKEMNSMSVTWTGGTEHWTRKGDIKLFLWNKKASPKVPHAGTIFFVHGSSMASQPTFDLHVPGRPYSSAMDWFADHGFDTWTMDNEGYGRSDKHRPINSDISNGADDLAAGSEYIMKATGARQLLLYGISSGALKAALFTERHPERVAKLALDAFVWTGEGSPTLEQRKKKLPDFIARNRRPIDRAFVHSIFQRDHPGTADEATVEAFADAILTLDDSMPTGTYVDMCSKLPLIDPAKITVPSIILRGEHDGIAGMDDLLAFFNELPNMNKQFSVMAGISHASFQQKNYMMVYQILHAFYTLQEPVYKG